MAACSTRASRVSVKAEPLAPPGGRSNRARACASRLVAAEDRDQEGRLVGNLGQELGGTHRSAEQVDDGGVLQPEVAQGAGHPFRERTAW